MTRRNKFGSTMRYNLRINVEKRGEIAALKMSFFCGAACTQALHGMEDRFAVVLNPDPDLPIAHPGLARHK